MPICLACLPSWPHRASPSNPSPGLSVPGYSFWLGTTSARLHRTFLTSKYPCCSSHEVTLTGQGSPRDHTHPLTVGKAVRGVNPKALFLQSLNFQSGTER